MTVGAGLVTGRGDDVRQMYSRFNFPRRNAEGVRAVHADLTRILASLGIPLSDLKGKRLLDAGCGTGEVACFLASQGADVTAIDFVESSLGYAREQAARLGLQNIRFLRGSLLDYPFEPNAYDYVLSHMVLHHTEDPAGGFANIARAAKPGGSVIFRVFCFWGTMSPFQKSPLWKRWVVRLVAGKDPDRRVRVGERLFYRAGHAEQHGLTKETFLYDLWGVPIVYHHTWGELMGWVRRNGLDFHSSNPSMVFSELMRPFLDPSRRSITRRGRILARAARLVLTVVPLHRLPACRRPSRLSRFLGQATVFVSAGANMITIRAIKPSSRSALD